VPSASTDNGPRVVHESHLLTKYYYSLLYYGGFLPSNSEVHTGLSIEEQLRCSFRLKLGIMYPPHVRDNSEGPLVHNVGRGMIKICKAASIFIEYSELTNKHHGAEPFLTSRQSRSYSRTSQNFMEPECSSPCSQEPSIDSYPEPDEFNP
jgi:hypothetical protein